MWCERMIDVCPHSSTVVFCGEIDSCSHVGKTLYLQGPGSKFQPRDWLYNWGFYGFPHCL